MERKIFIMSTKEIGKVLKLNARIASREAQGAKHIMQRSKFTGTECRKQYGKTRTRKTERKKSDA
jgi:hypothetical protein